MPKVYTIVNQYERPFRVQLFDRAKKAIVFKSEYEDKDSEKYTFTKFTEFKYTRAFPGVGYGNDCAFGKKLAQSIPAASKFRVPNDKCIYFRYPKIDGNAFLFHITGRRYRFIGGEGIFDFEVEPTETILSFHSEISNGEVPLPVAIGKKSVYYFADMPGKVTVVPLEEVVQVTGNNVRQIAVSHYYAFERDTKKRGIRKGRK